MIRIAFLLILVVACQASNQYQAGFLGLDQDCSLNDNNLAIDSFLLDNSDKNLLMGLYSTDETFSPYTLKIEEEGFGFYEHKLKAWHGESKATLKNSGQWHYIDNRLILNDNESQLNLKLIVFQSRIWLVPPCKEPLFLECISKINKIEGSDEYVTGSEILNSSFLHKKI